MRDPGEVRSSDSEAVPSTWAADKRAHQLWHAWRQAREPSKVRALLRDMAVPGEVSLRARYLLLTDPMFQVHPSAHLSESWSLWCRQVDLEQQGDLALVANDTDQAEAVFRALRLLEQQDHHRFVTVNALIGLADAARQHEDHEGAVTLYGEALRTATEDGYRFGQLRAMVSLAYATITLSSATDALRLFENAAKLARALDERLYVANALTGQGEALFRLGQRDEAMPVLEEALGLYQSLASAVGIGNAAQQVGDALYRQGRLAEAVPVLTRAMDAYEEAGLVIGAANAAGTLADVKLESGDVRGAANDHRRAYAFSESVGYRRGQVNAYAGLARCAIAVREWSLAARLYSVALPIFRELADLPGEAATLSGLAMCADAMGRRKSVHYRLEAVGAVEAMRAAHERADLQNEYRTRFAATYADALRAACAGDDPEAFVTVLEGLAGRRLAGLLEGVAQHVGQAELFGQIVARADQRLSGRNPLEPETDRRTRVLRMLGAAGLFGGLVQPAERAFEDAVSSLYQAFDPSAAAGLLEAVPGDAELVLLTQAPDNEAELAWLWREGDGTRNTGITLLPGELVHLLHRLGREGLDPEARPADVAPLSHLFPPELLQVLRGTSRRLVIAPLGSLWSVPWPAVVVDDDTFLGELAELAVIPSLSVYRRLALRASVPPREGPLTVATWRSPAIAGHPLDIFEDRRWDHRPLADAGAARGAITHSGAELVVVAGHGWPVAGVGHYLELDREAPLTPADLLGATTPPLLVLLSCWGATTPVAPASDPLTLATMALAQGSRQVAATVSELGDRGGTQFAEAFLHRIPDHPMPAALRQATVAVLRNSQMRHGRLRNWAPLMIVGAL